MIEARIQGIPCLINVTDYVRQPALGPWADSDMDCYGYERMSYIVCDRRGRPAPWLENKMTPDDEQEIEALISEEMSKPYDEY